MKGNILRPDQLFPEAQSVVGHLYVGNVNHPDVGIHKHCHRKSLQIGFFRLFVLLVLWLADDSLELNSLHLSHHAGFQYNVSGHINIMACLLDVPGVKIGGEYKAVILRHIDVKAAGAPWFLLKAGGQSENMVLVDEINNTLFGKTAHKAFISATKV